MTIHDCAKEAQFENIWKAIRAVNGWKFGFWVLVVITTIFLPTLSTYVIANDRLRATEDQRMQKEVSEKYDPKFDALLDKLSVVSGDVREIKTILKGNK